jgi:hypothetical protein
MFRNPEMAVKHWYLLMESNSLFQSQKRSQIYARNARHLNEFDIRKLLHAWGWMHGYRTVASWCRHLYQSEWKLETCEQFSLKTMNNFHSFMCKLLLCSYDPWPTKGFVMSFTVSKSIKLFIVINRKTYFLWFVESFLNKHACGFPVNKCCI